MALYVPRHRVRLSDWCGWTGNDWSKVSAVVGDGFRVPARHENVYTMAANAVLRLMLQYDVDPERVGLLALGTESSTDNAAGAVIVKGMVDRGLALLGKPPLSRRCEVPELKHACLGGVYAMKAALRYLSCDGKGRVAITVAADIAEYERGSSGEQTQGAGAVATLLEEEPTLFEVKLDHAGSASDYRGFDFRKPFSRHFDPAYASQTRRRHDFPIFNGRYSTFCYLDAVARAVEAMMDRAPGGRADYLESLAAILFHRPYEHLPFQALASLSVRQLSWSPAGRQRLEALAGQAGADYVAIIEELTSAPDLFDLAQDKGIDADPYPEMSKVVRALRKAPGFEKFKQDKCTLGVALARHFGNLYSASLPAWVGAAAEEALERRVDLTGRELLMVGYGSGDAAEAIPLRVVEGWRAAAGKLAFSAALEGAIDLGQAEYEGAHDGEAPLVVEPSEEFIVERVGEAMEPTFQDLGVEYYRYVATR